MAGLIVACRRDAKAPGDLGIDVRRAAAAIVPDNITPREALLWEGDGVVTTAVNPGPTTLFRDGSVAIGHLYEPHEHWWEPGAPPPDGAFALCRVAGRRIELVTDLYASRALWYAMTDSLFLASSSQRALVALLGSFELNDEAVSWMLSSGYLPPGAGWDARTKRVPPAGRLALDRERWTLDEARDPVPISPAPGTEREHVDRLRAAIMDACARLDVPWETWRLTLSGGMDSRAIALGLMGAGRKPRCITWGRKGALGDSRNDAVIADVVAARLGLPHVYYEVDLTGEPIAQVLSRYLAVSEGQSDQFGAYADGLLMWKRLFESGVAGVIRGDEPTQGYRWYYVSDEQCRRRGPARLVGDYPPTHPIHRLGLAPQTWPECLRKHTDESLCAYSGRLYQDFGFPAMLSPLNDLKGLYLEVANPLLSRGVVTAAHTLPESLRRGRRAMRAVHASMQVGVRFAKHGALVGGSTYLERPTFFGELRRGFALPAAERLFSQEAIATLEAHLHEAPVAASRWADVGPRVKKAVPKRVRERLRSGVTVTCSGTTLAFRAYIAVRMVELLTADAAPPMTDATLSDEVATR